MKKRYEDGVIPQQSIDVRMDMAQQMKAARLGLHMTQQMVADLAGTKKSNISRMESGKYNPTLDFLVKVAESMDKQISIQID